MPRELFRGLPHDKAGDQGTFAAPYLTLVTIRVKEAIPCQVQMDVRGP